MNLIRKISIGSDYKNSMHYVDGQFVLDKSYVISNILQLDDLSIQIWIEKDKEVVLWKSFSKDVPKVIEFRIDF